MRPPTWPPNVWETNLIGGLLTGAVVAAVRGLYDGRSWVSEYLLAGPFFVTLFLVAGWAGRRRAD